jgi:NADP-dependent 3-hydroxy acid dehydrogenase YdfG
LKVSPYWAKIEQASEGKLIFNLRMGEQKVILITGTSTGLGLAIAQRLLLEQSKRQHHLILTARESSLHRFSDCQINQNAQTWIRALDVTQAD